MKSSQLPRVLKGLDTLKLMRYKSLYLVHLINIMVYLEGYICHEEPRGYPTLN